MCELRKEDFKTFCDAAGAEYLIWYEDNDLKIAFSDIPDTRELKPNKTVMTKEQIEDIKKKPFKLYNTICVWLEDKKDNSVYIFYINEGYRWDGASIPSFAWIIVGSKEDVRFQVASMLHDMLCENHELVAYDRYFADKIFERCCYVGGTCAFVRWLMFHSVDNYQKCCGWRKKKDEGN